MAYVSDSNLTQFWGLAKDYIKAENSRYANWQQTDKAGAVTCWPVGGTELKPTVDFMFTETPPASGDKGADNPSTITGVSEVKVTRCGKNLIRRPYYYETRTINGVTFTVNEDGSITASGTATARCVFWVNNNPSILLVKGEGYITSGCPSGGGWGSYSVQVEIRKDGTYVGAAQDFGASETRRLIAAGDTARTAHVFIEVASGVSVSNLVFRPQLELGSTATSFEPYEGTDYTIPLGSTYYGGSIDLATGVMTVTKEYLTITTVGASDGISNGTAVCRAWPVSLGYNVVVHDGTEVCEEMPYATTGTGVNRFFVGASPSLAGEYPIYILIQTSYLDFSGAVDPSNPTNTEVRNAVTAYLTANPLHVVATRKEPYTVQLSPTQILSLAQPDKYTPRLNTVYTDASAVQVGYAKSPIRSEYELTQAIIATEGGE